MKHPRSPLPPSPPRPSPMDSSCTSPSHSLLKGLGRDRDRDRPHSAGAASRHDDFKRSTPSRSDRENGGASHERGSGDRASSEKMPASLPAASRSFVDRDGKDRGEDGREFRRKGHGSEKEGGDEYDESSDRADRSRNTLRKVSIHERFDRHYSGKSFAAERDRSEKSDGARRKVLDIDREGLEKFETSRSFGRRSYGGNGRHGTPDGSVSWEEKDYSGTTATKAARKGSGFDRDGRDGGDSSSKGSPSFDRCAPEEADVRRSPSGKGFRSGRDGADLKSYILNRDGPRELGRGSPRKEYAVEKDGMKTSRLSPRERSDSFRQRLSPRNAFESDRDLNEAEEMQRASFKSKIHSRKEDLGSFQRKEDGASSDEADTHTCRRSSLSKARGWGHDLVEERSSSEAHDEGAREGRSDMPITFLHIAKRVRSDRDRLRRDETGNKVLQRSRGGVQVEPDAGKVHHVEKQDVDVVGRNQDVVANSVDVDDKMMDVVDENAGSSGRKLDNRSAESEKRESENVKESHLLDFSSSRGDESEMEEGELGPDEDLLKEEQVEVKTFNLNEEQTVVDTAAAQEGNRGDFVTVAQNMEEEKACEGISITALESERQTNEGESGSHEVPGEASSKHGSENPRVKAELDEEDGMGADKQVSTDVHLQETSTVVSASKNREIGESSKAGLTLELLDEKTLAQEVHATQWRTQGREKGDTSTRELTLSLFTHPAGEQRQVSESEGQKTSSQSNHGRAEVPERTHNIQGVSSEQGLGVSGEGSRDHSGYGHKQKKIKLESLQLSLALPGTSVGQMGGIPPPLAAAPGEPARSFQSLTQTHTHTHTHTQTQNFSMSQTRTNSDGFTTSLSLSQSQSFIHNPSCSLNCTSMENQELSCGGSRQVSQGNEQMSHRSWQSPSANEQMSNGTRAVTSLSQDRSRHRREIPLYQRIFHGGGNMQHSQGFPSVSGSNKSSGSNRISQKSHQMAHRFQMAPPILDSSSQDIEGSGRQAGTRKDYPDKLRQQEPWPGSSQRMGSRETRSEPHSQRERERVLDYPSSVPKRFTSARNDDIVGASEQFSEKVGLHEIAAEPVALMAQKLQELPDSFLEGLKGVAKEVLGSFDKREEFITLQDKIKRRTDLTEETLLLAHRIQLEILVALKTGMQAFVQEGTKPLTNTALIEIFLQTKCRNIACQLSVPVDGCECRICSQKKGFCRECMCVVCLKFDTDSNTCRWVGCDVCLHWCHTDCGLRMSYIAPAPGIQSAKGSTYRCAACDHHSELFGFVKAVFQKCGEEWGAEALAKELDCVRRIFHGSEDMRGKQLCWKAEQMLQKLESKVDAAEVRRSMLRYFNEGNAELDGPCGANKLTTPQKPKEASDCMVDTAQESGPKTPSAVNKQVDVEKARAVLQTYDKNLEEKRSEAAELQYDRARKRAEIEDIESVVRIKQAESKMFQVRADEARQEASALKRIISVKREKIEEDYACKYAKLRLSEAEERRSKRFEELQALERAQQDYHKMKMRMEAEIKDLLLKMETTKRQFT